MAKQIVVLDTNPADGGMVTIRCALWFPVAPAAQIPIPSTAASAWANASASEITAIQSGAVLEEVHAYSCPKSYTTAQIKAELQLLYSDRVAYLASLPVKGQYYGVFFDGTVWSA